MNILIADDHSLFRDGLQQLLRGLRERSQPRPRFTHAANVEQTLAALRAAPEGTGFDLILLDLAMPGMGDDNAQAVKVLRQLRTQAPSTPLVVVSATEQPAVIGQIMAQGVAGYIPKSSSAEVMLGALRLIMFDGGSYVPPAILDAAVAEPEQTAAPLPDLAKLTYRQRDVLRLVANGLSNRQIAERLTISEGTVKVHIAAILKLLGVSNRRQAAALAERLLP